jgi:hypothetical protein
MIRVVGRERVGRFPLLQVQRELEDLRIGPVVTVEVLGTKHALLRDIRGALR